MEYKNFDSIYLERKNITLKDRVYNGLSNLKDEVIKVVNYTLEKFSKCFTYKKVRLDDYGDYSSGEDESLVS